MEYHFVLLHGACHGAWAWYKLIDRLQKAGHMVTALDMAASGSHPADADKISTHEEYIQPATAFFESFPEDNHRKVVLIGHSLGGLNCMQLMETFPQKIGLVILVAAVLTPNGVSVLDSGRLAELMFKDTPTNRAMECTYGDGTDKPPTSFWVAKSKLKEIFYTDWDSEDVVLASILGRPFPCCLLALPITYTEENYGRVPIVYIKYLRDNTLQVPAQHYIAENLGPFKEVVEIDGGHFHYWLEIDDFTKRVIQLTEKHFDSN